MRKKLLPFALLLVGGCATAPQGDPPPVRIQVPNINLPLPEPADEDSRLLAFLDAAFDEAAERSPETLTGLGIKRRYGELDRYTDEEAAALLALAERQT